MTFDDLQVGHYYWARRKRDKALCVIWCHGAAGRPRFSCARTHRVSPEDFVLLGEAFPPQHEKGHDDNVGM